MQNGRLPRNKIIDSLPGVWLILFSMFCTEQPDIRSLHIICGNKLRGQMLGGDAFHRLIDSFAGEGKAIVYSKTGLTIQEIRRAAY